MNNNGLMNMPLAGWFSEMEEDDYNYTSHGQMNDTPTYNLINDFAQEIIINTDRKLQQSSSSESCTSHPNTIPKRSNSFEISHTRFERPIKHIKTETPTPIFDTSKQVFVENPSNGFEISFGNAKNSLANNLKPKLMMASDEIISFVPSNTKGLYYDRQFVASKSRPPSRDQEHVIAERRRREKLNRQFIDLAAIVPGLKKMDKASVLGDAVTHLKRLQERVKSLEEQTNRKSGEKVILVNKSMLSDNNDDTSSSDENSNSHFEEALPQIEARVSDKNVLIRIHYENQKGLATKLFTAVESLQLTVVNSSFLPFGKYKMDITIVAQMDDESSIAVKDIVRNLREACGN